MGRDDPVAALEPLLALAAPMISPIPGARRSIAATVGPSSFNRF
jgi:hypothetical protein